VSGSIGAFNTYPLIPSNTYIVPSLTSGTLYEFKVIAVNKHGPSEDSPSANIRASGRPDTMAIPIVRDNGIFV